MPSSMCPSAAPGSDGEDLLELGDRFFDARRGGVEIGADAIEPVVQRRRRRLRRRPLRHAGQHDGQQAEGQDEPAEANGGSQI